MCLILFNHTVYVVIFHAYLYQLYNIIIFSYNSLFIFLLTFHRVNARVRYIEGDITENEMPIWQNNFSEKPEMLTEAEKTSFLSTLKGVSISSDAFFPFRDSLDHASKVGVEYVAQPGGSIADEDVIAACNEYKMSMCFTDLRLFHH